MEVNPCGLEEAVLEVIEVEEDVGLVERRLRITLVEVESPCSEYLHGRQGGNGLTEQLAFLVIVLPTGFASTLQRIEEGEAAEVALQIAKPVLALGHHLRHRQMRLAEMAGEIAEGTVLVEARADDSYERTALTGLQTIVLPVASCSRDGFDLACIETGCFLV